MFSKRFLTGIFLSAAIFTPSFIYAANSDVSISEVLFDPDGTDTSFEYIVVKNFGSSDISLTGWDLYPDGIGYFTFPSFSLSAGHEAKIHLHATGTADGENLYHSSASGNMSNSSGSVALFSGTAHSKDTIVSFLRYHKPGSTERKTWETTAASAGIWTLNSFVDISAGAEGKILTLTDFNNRFLTGSWSLNSTSTPAEPPSAPPASPAPSPDPSPASSPELSVIVSGSIPDPGTDGKIKAYAGQDRTVFAGADVDFEGSSESLVGEPLKNARFLWNFGDGMTSVGQKTSHSFLYPGVYTVSLNISLAEFSATDRVKITAIPNALTISEIKTGESGWLEVKNASAKTLDISNFMIEAGTDRHFIFPANTFISPNAFLVLSRTVLGFIFPDSGELKLKYPNGSVVASSSYPLLPMMAGESLSLIDGGWQKTKETPGDKNSSSILQIVSKKIVSLPLPGPGPTAKNSEKENLTASVSDSDLHQDKSSSFSEYAWLFGSIGIGGTIGITTIFRRRRKLLL